MPGDYQTPQRMAQKLKAIPIPDLTGKTVLDVGCDHGEFCRIASERGARRVLGIDRGRGVRGAGHVDLASRNAKQGWANTEFVGTDIVAADWPDFTEQSGRWDVVFCFSLYHHLYGACGDHDAIWRWLWTQTCPQGELLWEGPVNTRDPTARDRAKPHGDYTEHAILRAARRYFDVEVVGPALHKPHRKVFRCLPRAEPHANNGNGANGVRQGEQGVPGGAAGGSGAVVRAQAVPRDPKSGRKKPCGSCGKSAKPKRVHRPAVPRQAAPARRAEVVARAARRRQQAPRPERVARAPRTFEGRLPGGGVAAPPPAPWPGEWADRQPDPRIALILGGAECVWDDLRKLEALIGDEWPGIVIAVNEIGAHYPRPIDHWVSLHDNKFPAWAKLRAQFGHPPCPEIWASKKSRGTANHVHRTKMQGGSSSLFAAAVALEALDCELGVLVGAPLTQTPHFQQARDHPKGKKWTAGGSHIRAWKKLGILKVIQGRIKSMSGHTAQLLGEPDLEWLGLVKEAAA